MNIEQQVISLDIAKKLKSLGVKQESYFLWISRMNGDEEVSYVSDEKDWKEFCDGQYGWVKLSAFTVAESGEMLPGHLQSDKYINSKNGWGIYWSDMSVRGNKDHTEKGDKEADIRGEMLIYLLENNLINPKQTNEN